MREVRQRNVALILAREMAVNLLTPILIWDETGALVYFNEPAQAIIGRPYDDISDLRVDELRRFQPRDTQGNAVDISALASSIALNEKRPVHRAFTITGLDGVERSIEITAYPLLTHGNEFGGAMAVFWEPEV